MTSNEHGRPGDLLSLREYVALRPGNGQRDELVRGRLVREPPPGGEHGWLQLRLGHHLYTYVTRHGLGVVLSESGYILADTPPTVRGPDLSFIAADRLSGRPPRGLLRLVPDLVVEIESTSKPSCRRAGDGAGLPDGRRAAGVGGATP